MMKRKIPGKTNNVTMIFQSNDFQLTSSAIAYFRRVSVARPRGNRAPRSGHTTGAALLLEILLIAGVIWGVLNAIPMILNDGRKSATAKSVVVDRALLKIEWTSDAEQVWVQRGRLEIVSLDLKSRASRSIYRRQKRAIDSWQVSRDGKTFLVSIDSREVQIFRNHEMIASHELSVPEATLTALSADGETAICIFGGRRVHCWDLSTATVSEWKFELVEKAEKCALNSCGNKFVVCTSKGGIYIYNVKTGQRVKSIPDPDAYPREPVISPDGRQFAVIHGPNICLYDMESGELVQEFETPGIPPACNIAFAPDGSRLAASGASVGICVFDLQSGEMTHRFVHGSEIPRITFGGSSDRIISATENSTIRVWSLTESRELDCYRIPDELETGAEGTKP